MREDEYRAQYDVEETHWWFTSRTAYVRRVFTALGIRPQKHRVIADVGAGTGGMYRFLSVYGRVLGVEPHPKGRAYARKRGMPVRNATAQQTKLRARSQDMVCFFDVLYHKGIDDSAALCEARRILRPGGWLVITDCAVPWLQGPNDEAVEGRERYWLSRMKQAVEDAGFHPVKSSYMYFLVFPVFVLSRVFKRWSAHGQRMQSDVKPVSPVMNSILRALCSIEALALPYISFPWGSSVLVVAKRP